MCHRSPAKIMRSVRQITKFLEKKPDVIAISVLPSINIPPIKLNLSFSKITNHHIPPYTQPTSSKQKIPPELPPKKPATRQEVFDLFASVNEERQKQRNIDSEEDLGKLTPMLNLPPNS